MGKPGDVQEEALRMIIHRSIVIGHRRVLEGKKTKNSEAVDETL
jgi:hypothetical protein